MIIARIEIISSIWQIPKRCISLSTYNYVRVGHHGIYIEAKIMLWIEFSFSEYDAGVDISKQENGKMAKNNVYGLICYSSGENYFDLWL